MTCMACNRSNSKCCSDSDNCGEAYSRIGKTGDVSGPRGMVCKMLLTSSTCVMSESIKAGPSNQAELHPERKEKKRLHLSASI